jgi:hypothetical protein
MNKVSKKKTQLLTRHFIQSMNFVRGTFLRNCKNYWVKWDFNKINSVTKYQLKMSLGRWENDIKIDADNWAVSICNWFRCVKWQTVRTGDGYSCSINTRNFLDGWVTLRCPTKTIYHAVTWLVKVFMCVLIDLITPKIINRFLFTILNLHWHKCNFCHTGQPFKQEYCFLVSL